MLDYLLNDDCWLAEKPYRRQQSIEAALKNLITDWGQATNLPLALRQSLNETCSLNIDAVLSGNAADHSQKALIKLTDAYAVETVLIRHRTGRLTACLSSQIGCPLACAFCATGAMGFKRNLTAGEILAQALFWQRLLAQENKRLNNLVFMGMGEPLLNYQAVWLAIKYLINPNAFGIGSRHLSISTAGIVPGIQRLAKEPFQVNLAISLHAPTDDLRRRLMPINAKYNLRQLLSAVDAYIAATNRQVMFEYLLLKGINDSPQDAALLAELMRRPLCVVNLLPYNPTAGFTASDKNTQLAFKKVLTDAGIKVTVRNSLGSDIQAACGQLAGAANHC